MSKELLKNVLAAYNEAMDSNRMEEHIARLSIETAYKVKFTGYDKVTGRYTDVEGLSPVIENILKVADIHKNYISKELQQALIGKSQYIDNNTACREHLYYPSSLLDEPEEYEFNTTCRAELEVLKDIIEKADCAYLRIIN